ncbi:MAG: PAS domain-containing protein, partial [Candidatus Methylomirabilales bacterium]
SRAPVLLRLQADTRSAARDGPPAYPGVSKGMAMPPRDPKPPAGSARQPRAARAADALALPAAALAPDGRLRYANSYFAALLDVQATALVGTGLEERVAPEDRARYRRLVEVAGLALVTAEITLLAGDGTRRPVHLRLARRNLGGDAALLLVAIDLTPYRALVTDLTRRAAEPEAEAAAGTAEVAAAKRALERELANRQQAEAALRQGHADLNRAQAVARTGSWRLDARRGELWWSDETYRIFGMPPGVALTYASFLAAVHPEDREYVDQRWTAALGGAPYDIEHRILVGSEVKWVRERAELEHDDHGQLLGGFGTVQDITDRKTVEAERRSLALFPAQNPSPVLRIAHDGTLLYANAASQPLLAAWGCAVGSRLSRRSPFLEVWTVGHAVEHEFACEGRVYSLVCVPFQGEGYVNVYGRDITQRKRAERALADSQHLLHSILEQASEGITVRDAQGRVMFVNAVSRRRARQRPEGTPLEMAPQVWGEYLDPDGKPVPVGEWPAAHALRGETATREFLRQTPTGSLYVVNSGAPLRNDAGEIIGAVTITTDISERKRMEDRLREALSHEERALADNVTLLREVHHRTKNTLQMLCDMLYLQMEAVRDEEKAAVLRDSYGRIYAIARLHEQLYGSLRGGRVLLRDYLRALVTGPRPPHRPHPRPAPRRHPGGREWPGHRLHRPLAPARGGAGRSAGGVTPHPGAWRGASAPEIRASPFPPRCDDHVFTADGP